MPETALLISCEHAVNHVPARWRALFADAEDLLASHRAYDPGALALARTCAARFAAPCFAARITRLLIDHNRSLHNPALWSDLSRALPEADKTRLLEAYYRPFRRDVAHWIAGRVKAGGRILHLSVHTFTPVFEGQVRSLDIGLLYDPQRPAEQGLAREWQRRFAELAPELRVRRNAPYRGRSDCHQTEWRARLPHDRYLGIELEVSQQVLSDPFATDQVAERIISSLQSLLPDR